MTDGDLDGADALPFAYLTTTGRRTGRPHRIEIWFGRAGGRTLYLLAGGGRRSDWVANLEAAATVEIEVGDGRWTASARIIEDAEEAALARRLLFEKYQPTYGGDLSEWRERALPVAVDLSP